MVFAADNTGYGGGAVSGFFAMEKVTVVEFDMFDSIQPPHKIQMPIAASKFAVCDHMIPGSFLAGDQFCDFFVFNRF